MHFIYLQLIHITSFINHNRATIQQLKFYSWQLTNHRSGNFLRVHFWLNVRYVGSWLKIVNLTIRVCMCWYVVANTGFNCWRMVFKLRCHSDQVFEMLNLRTILMFYKLIVCASEVSIMNPRNNIIIPCIKCEGIDNSLLNRGNHSNIFSLNFIILETYIGKY